MLKLPERVRHHILSASIRATQNKTPRWQKDAITLLITAEMLGKKLLVDELHRLLVESKAIPKPTDELAKARSLKMVREGQARVSKFIEATREDG